jgi:superfamily II DNA/RNA helicase
MLEQGRARARMPRTLILEPTRELAAQVVEHFEKYGKNHKLNVALIIGGVSFDNQDAKLMKGVDVLIATPGRLLDHHERGRLLLTGVELLVIDEADRMLDMGFIPDIERICKLVPFTRQTLFFTATMPPEIRRVTEQFLHNPVKVEVSKPATAATTITQQLVKSGRQDYEKRDVLRRVIRSAEGLKNGIIFCNRKLEVAAVYRSLKRHGFSVGALHGDMSQPDRTATLDGFRKNEITLLVASDVAARGLDIPDVCQVFNYDVPHHADDYVHRIGRTGRAGRLGVAQMIVTSADSKSLAAIEQLTGQQIPWVEVPGGDAEAPADEGAPAEQRSRAPRGERSRSERGSRSRNGRGRDRHRGERNGSEAHAEVQTAERLPSPSRHDEPAKPIRRSAGRPPQRLEADTEGDVSHLPAFLLRPVSIKA